jgi:rhodanese-related sulfurtransferase
MFVKQGFQNVRALLGGMQAWKDAGYPMEAKKMLQVSSG